MKKNLAMLAMLISCNVYSDDSTAGRKMLTLFLLEDDAEMWLTGNKSFFDWSSVVDKNKLMSPDSVLVQKLYADYSVNEFAAEKKYGVVPQKIYGYVAKVEKDPSGEPVLSFVTGNYLDSFIAYGFTKNEVMSLQRNQQIEIVCHQFKYDLNTLYSAKCVPINRYVELLAKDMVIGLNNKTNAPYGKKNLSQEVLGQLGWIMDYMSDSDYKLIAGSCSEQYITQPECKSAASNAILRSKAKVKAVTLNYVACARENKECPGMKEFAEKYKVDFSELAASQKEQEDKAAAEKRKKNLKKLASVFGL